MQLEFAKSNYIDVNDYSLVGFTFTNFATTYQAYMYDHTSENQLVSTGADDDTTAAIIEVDLGEDKNVNLIKVLNTNAKGLKIEVKEFGGSYETVLEMTDNDSTGVSYYSNSYEGETSITTEDGEQILIDPSSLDFLLADIGNNIMRYIKITMTATMNSDEEKTVGELYIGQRSTKIEQGKVLRYQESFTDKRGSSVSDYLGRAKWIRVRSNLSASISVGRPSQEEFDAIKSAVKDGGIFEFFPTATALGNELDMSLSLNDVYRVEFEPKWNYTPYGADARGLVSFKIGETYVTT